MTSPPPKSLSTWTIDQEVFQNEPALASLKRPPTLPARELFGRIVDKLPSLRTFLCRGNVLASEWRIGLRLSPAQQHRSHGRITLPFLKTTHNGTEQNAPI